MNRLGVGLILAMTLAGAVRGQEALAVPSAQPIHFHEVIMDQPGPEGLTARFRFVAPLITTDGSGIDFFASEADMQFLCETYALPRLSNIGPQVSQVVVSLSSRPTPFGQSDPNVVQFFESYRPEGEACIWEEF